MSDYLQAASFIHAGKDWPFNASNHLKEIKIESPDHNFIHMVYSLPRRFMRSNAATFGDWQKNEEGSHKSQAQKATFCWFLDFVNRMSKSKPPKPDPTRQKNRRRKIPYQMETVWLYSLKWSNQILAGWSVNVSTCSSIAAW